MTSDRKMNAADRKLLMRRIAVLRESYRLEADMDAAIMLTVLRGVPEKIRMWATEFLQEQEPDAGWVYYSGRGACMTPPEPVQEQKEDKDEAHLSMSHGGYFPW